MAVPPLVQLCQRLAVANTQFIHDLGPLLPYKLAKPILERASSNVEHLLLLEQSAPHLMEDSLEIWKDLCFRDYYLTAVKRYSPDDIPIHPDSWRARYFEVKIAETRRLDELGSKLRQTAMEADQRKREKEIKFTDRVPPPPKRYKGWGVPTQPKTLFQKTRSEASKIQKAVYGPPIPPPMPTSKMSFLQARAAGMTISQPPSSSSSSSGKARVTVNTIIQHKAVAHVTRPLPSSSTLTSSSTSLETIASVHRHRRPVSSHASSSSTRSSSSGRAPSPTSSHTSPESEPSPLLRPTRPLPKAKVSRIQTAQPQPVPAPPLADGTPTLATNGRHQHNQPARPFDPSRPTASTSSSGSSSAASSRPGYAMPPSNLIPKPDLARFLDRPIKSLPSRAKKDPMACLFMPKQKAYSQRPCPTS